MGGSASKARRTLPQASRIVKQEAAASAGERVPPAAVAPRAAAPPPSEPPPEQGRDEGIVQGVSALMRGVSVRPVQLYTHPEVDQQYARPRLSREEKEARLRGRLDVPSIKHLYNDRIRAWHEGREPPSVAALAAEYGADAGVLDKVLRYNSVPAVRQAPGGRLVGVWPGSAAAGEPDHHQPAGGGAGGEGSAQGSGGQRGTVI